MTAETCKHCGQHPYEYVDVCRGAAKPEVVCCEAAIVAVANKHIEQWISDDKQQIIDCVTGAIREALRHVVSAQLDEAQADHYTILRMGELLAEVAVALKGPEEASKRHGYQDLPQLVQAKVFEIEILKQQVADYAAMYEPFKAMVDDVSDAMEAE